MNTSSGNPCVRELQKSDIPNIIKLQFMNCRERHSVIPKRIQPYAYLSPEILIQHTIDANQHGVGGLIHSSDGRLNGYLIHAFTQDEKGQEYICIVELVTGTHTEEEIIQRELMAITITTNVKVIAIPRCYLKVIKLLRNRFGFDHVQSIPNTKSVQLEKTFPQS